MEYTQTYAFKKSNSFIVGTDFQLILPSLIAYPVIKSSSKLLLPFFRNQIYSSLYFARNYFIFSKIEHVFILLSQKDVK